MPFSSFLKKEIAFRNRMLEEINAEEINAKSLPLFSLILQPFINCMFNKPFEYFASAGARISD